MVVTWQKVVFLIILVAAGIWVYLRFFASMGETYTSDLPALYASGNPVALAELKKRPYETALSPAFRKMASTSGDARVREAAVTYLARGTDPAEEGIILSALNDSDPKVREAACAAAAARKLKQAIPIIIPLLDDEIVGGSGAPQRALQDISGVHKYMGRSEWEQRWEMELR